jgi:hypothetical protein
MEADAKNKGGRTQKTAKAARYEEGILDRVERDGSVGEGKGGVE